MGQMDLNGFTKSKGTLAVLNFISLVFSFRFTRWPWFVHNSWQSTGARQVFGDVVTLYKPCPDEFFLEQVREVLPC